MARVELPPLRPQDLFDVHGVAFDVDLVDGCRDPRRPRRWKPTPRRLAMTRVAVFSRDGWSCGDCGLTFPHEHPDVVSGLNVPVVADGPRRVFLTLHHIVSWHDGGPFKVANLRALCDPCNASRGSRGDR